MKYIKGFVLFWYDFIVGDTWEVAAGVILSLVLLYALTHYTSANTIVGGYAALLLPIIIVALLGYSLWRVRRSG